MASLSRLLAVLVVAVGLLSAAPAQAQIEATNPGKIKAANRHALRENRRTDSPYKDSHLEISPLQLKRGQSIQDVPGARQDPDYTTGAAPAMPPAGFLGLRRKNNNLHRPPAQSGKRKDKDKKK